MFTSPCARLCARGYACGMKIILLLGLLLFLGQATAASKPHAVVLGKWSSLKRQPESEGTKSVELKSRALFIDGRVKEYTAGAAHEVTDRIFVVQRLFRINDSLPQETGPVRWRWELGGWLAIDRVSGKVQAVNLPDFDPDFSLVSWFRDYAAYCGIADEGNRAFAIIVQLGRRKPILKKSLESGSPACEAPQWQRDPARAIFDIKGAEKFTYSIKGRSVDLTAEAEENSPED
jgi:hypothetical protein